MNSRVPELAVSIRWQRLYVFGLLCCIACVAVAWQRTIIKTNSPAKASPVSDGEIDVRLQQSAVSALEAREGTIIVLDPRTGRIRAIVNPRMAFQDSFAPGSTIKPFTALAAMRFDLINTPLLCREKYSHRGFQTHCSHELHLGPLNTSEAIAYSCNFYFAKLGERFREPQFRTLLWDFGFGQTTGVNAELESAGKLQGDWHSQYAIGEGDYLHTTPIQLLMAYATLVNGGQLNAPRIAGPSNFSARLRRNVTISESEREVIFQGMRGAIRFGTARKSGLDLLPLNILGKTGTSTPYEGFRPQGWFVGFGFASRESSNPDLGVLVFLKKGHGSDAAQVSRSIFEEYTRCRPTVSGRAGEWASGRRGESDSGSVGEWASRRAGDSATNVDVSQIRFADSATHLISHSPAHRLADSPAHPLAHSPTPQLAASLPRTFGPSTLVRVYLTRSKVIQTLPLEQYLTGVVAAEGSTETELEALKALAITSRTYALTNQRRHAAADYDFCDSTHCQRFKPPDAGIRTLVLDAVHDTEGEVLTDPAGDLAETYFSASCGGETANITTLWGGRPISYLGGVPDEYCTATPHSHWMDVISAGDLLRALRSDVRADVGNDLKNIFVSRQDRTGRAEQITLVGSTKRTISGWEFKIIVGRALGWNLLKSSRFQVKRAGNNFVFRGSGFGHGLGLCQEGAHVMAERGLTYRQILKKYFPGTNLRANIQVKYAADLLWSGSAFPSPTRNVGGNRFVDAPTKQATTRKRVASEHFRINYPSTILDKDAAHLLQLMEETRSALLTRPFLPSNIELPYIEVFINESTGDFVSRTGLPFWAAAGSKGGRIELQPLTLLMRRRILDTTIRHELVHKIIDSVGRGSTPRWLAEGLAVYLAGEGQIVSRYQSKTRLSTADLEQRFAAQSQAHEMRELYAAAYIEVWNLIRSEGEAAVWQRVAQPEK